MNKKNKVVLGLLVALMLVLIPKVSSSKDDNGIIVLNKDNLLLLNNEVNGESTALVIAKAKQLDSELGKGYGNSKKPMYLFLNTPGGNIQSGLEMIEALKGIGRPIHTVTLFAASMGFQIAQNLDERLILKNGILMSHHASGEFKGSFGGVRPSQVDNRYQLWLDRMQELDEQTVKRTNGKQTYESYIKQYDKEVWLTGTKAVAQGYADKVVLVRCGSTLNGSDSHKTTFLGLDVTYELDNCPLNTSPMKVNISAPDGKPLTSELQKEMKDKFMSQFENKQGQVIPAMY